MIDSRNMPPNFAAAHARQQERRHPPGCPCVNCRRQGIVVAAKALALPLIVSSPTKLDFRMDFEPPEATSQLKGEQVIVPKDGGKPFVHHYTKKRIEKVEKELRAALAPFAPAAPFTGPLRLLTEWTWTWRASEPKKNRVAGWRYRETKPDWDNISKMLCDQMAALKFFNNDSQIVDARVTKAWGDRPGIRITLEGLENP